MSDINLACAMGNFKIKRLPHRNNEILRAWDAADIQLIDKISEIESGDDKSLMIVNDQFGALSVALHSFQLTNWSDSWVSHQSLRENFISNDLGKTYKTLDSVHVGKTIQHVVVMKVPKSMALFEFQLIKIKPIVNNQTKFYVAGMVKHMPNKVWQLLESIIGETDTSLGVKKAKLIQVAVDDTIDLLESDYPKSWQLENSDIKISNHANVFSLDHLDVGTRFLLEHLPLNNTYEHAIDLGCGNGVIGLMMAKTDEGLQVTFIDESYMAIDSVKENVKQLLNIDRFKFHCGNGLMTVKKLSADIILCNPPFHQHHSTGEAVALTMFSHSARVLQKDGELWIVGNRHLAYHSKLTTWFYDVVLIASNKNFVVLKASNPKK